MTLDDEGIICAQCITALPALYPVTARHWRRDSKATRVVNSWNEAADSVLGEGLHITDPDGVTYGIRAATFVAGTALCFSHAALAQSRADSALRTAQSERHGHTPGYGRCDECGGPENDRRHYDLNGARLAPGQKTGPAT